MLTTLAGTGVALGIVATAYFAPHLLRFVHARRLGRMCRASRSMVLTYDDGPGRGVTPRVLDALARHDAKATFFLLGRPVQEHPELVELVDRIAGEEHEIGSHGFAHVSAWRAMPWRVVADINRGMKCLAAWLRPGAPFRPPFGRVTAATWWASRRHGARLAFWTIDTLDSGSQPRAVADIVGELCSKGGGVVLMHDYDGSEERTRTVLTLTEQLIAAAREKGLRIRRLCDLTPSTKDRRFE